MFLCLKHQYFLKNVNKFQKIVFFGTVMSVQLGFKAEEIIAEGRVTSDDINKINNWLKEQKKFPAVSDEEIINFLLSNDNDQEKTKNTIKAFFKIRKEGPDIFNNRIVTKENFESAQSFGNSFVHIALAPKRTKDNCAVIFSMLHDTAYQNFDITKYFQFLFMTLDSAVYSSPPNGLIVVMDLKGLGLMHITKLKVHALSIFFRYLQEALPVKLKNIHLLNTPYFMDKILLIIKPLMSKHINKLMIYHKIECNMEEFFEKYVAKDLLPQDFGGELPCMESLAEQLVENLKNMESYFTAEEARRSSLDP